MGYADDGLGNDGGWSTLSVGVGSSILGADVSWSTVRT